MDDEGILDDFSRARRRMIEHDLKGRGISDAGVLGAMEAVRREEFVPEPYRSQAYSDGPLPIGSEQTISQPYIVALMTEELHVGRDCEVLEIGTGSGYQTAVLSRLAQKVYTIETIGVLSESAQAVLGGLGISNVEFRVGDGSSGWPEERSFGRIMITAAVPKLPGPVCEQLAEGGLIVGPVGPAGVQELVVCKKRNGKMIERKICDVRFVKLLGEYGFTE